MNRLCFFYSATIISIIIFVVLTTGNTGGPAGGFTGSPADGKTCGSNGGCHTGNQVIAQTGWITSDIPSSGYLPGDTFSITATVTKTGISKSGFQLSPQNSSGTKLGILLANSSTQLKGNGKYIEHVATSTPCTNSNSWTFNWIAPAPGTGQVTFYAAFNATNSNGSTSGDQIYTSSLMAQEDTVTGMGITPYTHQVNIFPNPNSGKFSLDLSNIPKPETMEIYNIAGKIIFQTKIPGDLSNIPIDVSENHPGFYFLRINSQKSTFCKTFVIQ